MITVSNLRSNSSGSSREFRLVGAVRVAAVLEDDTLWTCGVCAEEEADAEDTDVELLDLCKGCVGTGDGVLLVLGMSRGDKKPPTPPPGDRPLVGAATTCG